MLNDENVQRYAKALYPVALLLVLVPLIDLSLRTFPPQFGTLQWRFATVGLLLGNFGTLLLGFGLIGLMAVLTGHRRVLRVLGFVTLVLGVLVLAVLVLFALDAVQIRRLANQNFKRAILLSSLGALFNGMFGAVALFALGRGSLVASRVARTVPAKRAPSSKAAGGPSPLVVGTPSKAGEPL